MKRNILITLCLSTTGIFPMTAQTGKTPEGEKTMDRIELCKQNFTTLFGDEALNGKGTDPEMMDILQKYIFGEVFRTGNLEMKTRELITCVTLATMQQLPQLKAHSAAALNVGVTPIELREAIYQCAPNIGFPKTLNALGAINAVFAERNIPLPLEYQGTVTEENRYEKGYAIQEPRYGDRIKEMLKGLPGGMEDTVARYLTEIHFGDFQTRTGLDLKTRELLTYCVIATMEMEPQMRSHLIGNLKVGNSLEDVTAAVIQCMPYIGFPKAFKTLKVIRDYATETVAKEPLFGLGEHSDQFTGDAWTRQLSGMKESDSRVYNVTFAPRSRNNWHSHKYGQVLLCTDGIGFYKEKGKAARRLQPGDVVEIPAETIHWHGAAPDSQFSHVGFTSKASQNTYKDYGAVTDKEYESACKE